MNTASLQRRPAIDAALADDGLHTTDCTGVQTGNADLEGAGTWTGPADPQPAPLPIYPGGVDLLDRMS